jgi:hypothetical protein
VTAQFRFHRNAAVRRRPRPPAPNPVMVVRVDADVWAKATELADGDIRRLRVLDGQTVLVANQPRRETR